MDAIGLRGRLLGDPFQSKDAGFVVRWSNPKSLCQVNAAFSINMCFICLRSREAHVLLPISQHMATHDVCYGRIPGHADGFGETL